MNAKEIGKLRKKFVAAAMASFFLVVLFIGVLINAVHYQTTEREIWWTLEEISEKKEDADSETETAFSENPGFMEVFSPSFHRSLFYIISFDSSHSETSFISSRTHSSMKDAVRKTAGEILENGSDRGQSGMYYYLVKPEGENTSVILLDCSGIIYSRIRLLNSTVLIGTAAILITFLLVLILSGRMIQPEIEMSRKQLQFLTNVSHELKTPLAVIRSNAEMEEIACGENEWTKSTIRQVDRMDSLIKDLVMITKRREQENGITPLPIDVSGIAEETAGEFRNIAMRQGKRFETEISEALLYPVQESSIRQLLMILLDNAVKYCDENGEIVLSLHRWKKHGIRIAVQNSYKEGSTADCAKFFERFYRRDPARTIDNEGFGIGLSIAESICAQYHGTIQAEWKDGRIAFLCELP